MSLSFSRQFYRFKITKQEADFVLNYAPKVWRKENAGKSTKLKAPLEERIEMIKRILSKDTASPSEAAYAQRQDIPGTTGEMTYQIRNLDIKMKQLEVHLQNNKKDVNTKRVLQESQFKQVRNLKYLKKKNPLEYIKLTKELEIKI